ncbi:MAG: PQQ-binding-like beta-propeller repeat protein [Planctomycetota bacterium]
MTLKGTLDTFDLRELLQMLAFNQKVGTLRLKTEQGPRSVYLDRGRCTFLADDPDLSRAFAREARRRRLVRSETVEHALGRALAEGRYVADLLEEEGVLEAGDREPLHAEVAVDRLLDAQLMAVEDFEFHDGCVLAADGHVAVPAQPLVPVEGLLLDLARCMDQWERVSQVVPDLGEVFEGTGVAVDLDEDGPVSPDLVRAVLPQLDGYRSVADLADASDVSHFDAAQVVAAVAQAGGAHAVSTEDLLERAELQCEANLEEGAIPLLRLAVTRGDAPPRTRFRLAEVAAHLGRPDEAIAVLEGFVRQHGGADVEGALEALLRVLALRENDPGVARRICDLYLQHRVELRGRVDEARRALGLVIRHAVSVTDAREAAQRLATFLENDDAPGEDLRVLADLYAQADLPHKAAQALTQRAEEQLEAGRSTSGRELLRRALALDPGCGAARRRLAELDTQRRTRHQRARLRFALIALVTAVGAVGVLWWNHHQQTEVALGAAEQHAGDAVSRVEREVERLASEFIGLRERARLGEVGPEEVRHAADEHVAVLGRVVREPTPDLEAFAAEIERTPTGDGESAQRKRLATLEERLEAIEAAGAARVRGLLDQARDAYEVGLGALRQRRLRYARDHFRIAHAFGWADEGVAENATRQLAHVNEILDGAEKIVARIEEARGRGHEGEAYRRAIEGLRALIGTGLESEIRFGAVVRSTPPAARVLLDGKDTGLVTPCTVTWSATSEQPRLELRKTGHERATFELPCLFWLQTADPRIDSWSPILGASLARGPIWRSEELASVRDLWVEDDGVIVLRSDGRRVHGVDLATGEAREGSVAGADADGMERGGALPGGTAWRVQRSRFLRVAPPYMEPWSFETQMGIEQSPAMAEGVILVVDSAGNAYGLDAESGKHLWARRLESAPSQTPYASGLGFVVGTLGGAALAIEPATGKVKTLLRSTTGPVLALPFGTGVALLEHGPRGFRVAHADGRIEVLDEAAPRLRPHPAVGPEGIVWMEAGGAVRAQPRRAIREPLDRVAATARHWTLDGSTLFVVDSRGRLQALDLARGGHVVLEADLGAPPTAAPAVTSERVVVPVEGALVGVQR